MQIDEIFPTLENGEQVVPGSRVRLADGSLMLVKTIALSAAGTFVAAEDVAGGAKPAFIPADGLADAGYDTQEDLDADAVLPVAAYIKKRALDVDPAATRDEKLAAMTRDIMARQRAVILAQARGAEEA